jgi:hypothetical protein
MRSIQTAILESTPWPSLLKCSRVNARSLRKSPSTALTMRVGSGQGYCVPMQPAERIGLCSHCRHVQVIDSARGSSFYLCRLSLVNPAFAKYPRLPVLRCAGFEEAPQPRQASGDQ